jgi:hypothetical protein
MTAKFSPVVASNVTVGDRLLNVGNCALQLSTQDLVFMVYDPSQNDPGKVSIMVAPAPAHTAPSLVATLNATTSSTPGAGTFYLGGKPQSLAMCRDGKDNLFVFGASAWVTGHWTRVQYQGFTKGAGLVWNPVTSNQCLAALTGAPNLLGFAATWCNTGGGATGAGHILLIVNYANGTISYVLSVDAILAGAAQNGASVLQNPAFLGDPGSGTEGTNLDITNMDDTGSFGTANGLAVSANGIAGFQAGSWNVTSTGQLTTGQGIAEVQSTATLSVSTKLRVVYLPNQGQWAVVVPSANPGTLLTTYCWSTLSAFHRSAVDTTTASNFPANGGGLAWDVIADPAGTLWIYGWSTQASHRDDMLRVAVTFPGDIATLGSVAVDDTAVGGTGTTADNTTIRTVKSPVTFFAADWQAYDTVSPYSLLGDFSVLPVTPEVPVLVSPPTGSVLPFAAGGTLDWNFVSLEPTDAQVSYYLRRHTSAGYQWWNGTSWTTAQAGFSGGSEIAVTSPNTFVTFGAGQWTAGTTYSWSVQTVGASGLPSGYANQPAFQLIVVTPPATPTLTATYDSANNRVTLVAAGTGTDHAWFQYSDDGVTWFNVARATAVPMVAGAAQVYDYWAPLGAPRSYRVNQIDPAGTPGNYSASSSTHTATPASGSFWLRRTDIDDIGINPHIAFGTLDTVFDVNQTEHKGLGNPATIVVSDVLGLEDGVCTFFSLTAAEEALLLPYLQSQSTLLLQSPDNRSFFVRWNVARPVNVPYVVQPGSYREHSMNWRGQSTPPA